MEKASSNIGVSFVGTAFAQQNARSGSDAFDQSDRFVDGRIIRERRWENGVLESITLDPRSGNIIDRKFGSWDARDEALDLIKGDQGNWLAVIDGKKFKSVPLYKSNDFYYATLAPIDWIPNFRDSTLPAVHVPRGFVTTMGSVPQIFWSLLPPESHFIYASVVLDYLYWDQKTSREDANRIFREMLLELNATQSQVDVLYEAVKIFGQAAWDASAKSKANGEKRVVVRLPDDSSTTWKAWRSRSDTFK